MNDMNVLLQQLNFAYLENNIPKVRLVLTERTSKVADKESLCEIYQITKNESSIEAVYLEKMKTTYD